MAGSSNAEDNPVAINVTAMVDVIFCLCLFFMCSFKFKELEGKLDTFLPQDKGVRTDAPPPPVILEEIRVFMRTSDGVLTRRVGNNAPSASDADLMARILAQKADYTRLGKTEAPILLDATEAVNWEDVIHVVDLCKAKGLERVEFVAPMEAR